MEKEKYIIGIGAANVDICGRSYAPVNYRDSNPGSMHVSVGGVTRNILENYARLGGKCILLTVVGDDIYGRKILRESAQAGIDVSHVMTVKEVSSSTYMSVMNNDGDLAVALSDMNIMSHFSVEYLHENDSIIRDSQLIVCDPSIPETVMDHLLDDYDVPVYVDPVSIAYAKCIKDKIGRFHTVKPNVNECQLLSGCQGETKEELIDAAKKILSSGLDEIYVSRGREGSLYLNKEGCILESRLKPLEETINATGAGDAFMAMVIYGRVNGYDKQKTLDYASAAGIAAITAEDTINKKISIELIENILEERRK